MKTRIVVNTPGNIPAWRQPVANTDRILNEVRKLTRDLHALQNELYRELAEEDGSIRASSCLRLVPACDDLLAFKAAADQLRRVLWFYVQDTANGTATHLASSSESKEPLVLQESLVSEAAAHTSSGASTSFLERLNLVIDGYMQDRGISTMSKPQKS